MKDIILIGFEYDKNNKFLGLPGIIIDLYQMYKIGTNIAPDNIFIITDIERNPKTKILKNAVLEGIVDENILDFIDDIKESHKYIKYCNLNNFIQNIINIYKNSKQIVLYFTGHCISGNIILPDNTSLSYEDLLNILITYTNINAEILIIMDCCESTDMGLPYMLQLKIKSSIYRLTSNKNKIFPKQKIIYISSSIKDENSISHKDGSFFTRVLYKQFKNKNSSLVSILNIINNEYLLKYNQTASIYSSFPNIKYIWYWLFNISSYNFNYNENLHCLILTPSSYNNNRDKNSNNNNNKYNKKNIIYDNMINIIDTSMDEITIAIKN